jgi:phage-related protein
MGPFLVGRGNVCVVCHAAGFAEVVGEAVAAAGRASLLDVLSHIWDRMVMCVIDKPIFWMGSSLGDLSNFPLDVRKVMGFALRQAQQGGKHIHAKPLKGHKGASVLEIVADHDSDTFRSVYTVQFKRAIYVLHAFQKKSKSGIKTARSDLDLIAKRLKAAKEHYEDWLEEQAGHGDGGA